MRSYPMGLAALALTGCVSELPDLADPCVAWDEPGLYQLTIERPDTKKRKAMVWVPSGPGPRPVVTMLHGAGQTDDDIQASSQWIRHTKDAVVVFPSGILRSWNAGECCAFASEERKNVDDVGYLEELARTVKSRTCGTEMLVAGFSNGAMMAHRWACEGNQVDAVIPAAGPIWQDAEECRRPVPIRQYHGTRDATVPIDGGKRGPTSPSYRSAEASIGVWQVVNECADDEPTVTTEGDTTCSAWDCAVPTELCVMEGVGHVWPGGIRRSANEHDATLDGYDRFRAQYE